MPRRYRILGIAAIVALVLDQVSKWAVMQFIPEHRPITVIAGLFDLVNIRNRGAAFGFLNDPAIDWQFWLFLGATLIGCGLVIYLMRSTPPSRLLTLGLAGILGGALGNLIDRVRFRAVVDFLDFYYGQWHWPAFNVADIGICAGAALVLIIIWKGRPTAALSHEHADSPKNGKKK